MAKPLRQLCDSANALEQERSLPQRPPPPSPPPNAKVALAQAAAATHEEAKKSPCPSCGELFVLRSGDKWNCSKCYQECTAEARFEPEMAALRAAEAVDAIDTPSMAKEELSVAAVLRGIQVGVLKKIAMAERLKGLTTNDVVVEEVRPRTAGTRLRFIELLAQEDPIAQGPATVFVSHTWKVPFVDTVSAIAHVLPDTAYVWFDIFAVRQWPGNTADLDFRGVISSCRALLLVVAHMRSLEKPLALSSAGYSDQLTEEEIEKKLQAEYKRDQQRSGGRKGGDGPIGPTNQDINNSFHIFQSLTFDFGLGFTAPNLPPEALKKCAFMRVWCIVELCEALDRQIPVVMLCGGSKGGGKLLFEPKTSSMLQMYSLVDVRKATATFLPDKTRILNEVEAGVGADAVNTLARGCITGASAAMFMPAVLQAALGDWSGLGDLRPSDLPAALFAACSGGYTNVVKVLLEAGVAAHVTRQYLNGGKININSIKPHISGTPLLGAARGGHVKVAQQLVDAGAPIDGLDLFGGAPLVWAAYGGHLKMVEFLLEKKADIERRQLFGRVTPLHMACARSHAHVVDALLLRGAKPSKLFEPGISCMHIACVRGDTHIIKALLAKGAKPDPLGFLAGTPIMNASQSGKVEVVKLLTEAKANPRRTMRFPWWGSTVIGMAAFNGEAAVIELLCKARASPNQTSWYHPGSYMPLQFAAAEGHLNAVTTLLQANHVRVNAGSTMLLGQTALVVAAKEGFPEIVEKICEKGAWHGIYLAIAEATRGDPKLPLAPLEKARTMYRLALGEKAHDYPATLRILYSQRAKLSGGCGHMLLLLEAVQDLLLRPPLAFACGLLATFVFFFYLLLLFLYVTAFMFFVALPPAILIVMICSAIPPLKRALFRWLYRWSEAEFNFKHYVTTYTLGPTMAMAGMALNPFEFFPIALFGLVVCCVPFFWTIFQAAAVMAQSLDHLVLLPFVLKAHLSTAGSRSSAQVAPGDGYKR